MTVRRCARRRALATLIAILALTVTVAVTSLTAAGVAAAWAPAGSLPGLSTGRVWSLAIDPADPHVALAATDHGVYRSEDAGATWKQTSLASGTVWAVGFDVRTPNPALAGLDSGGVMRSDDKGVTWTASSSGLPSSTVRSLAFGLSGVAAGTANGVAVSVDGRSWRNVGLPGFDISALAVSANAPQITLIAAADHVPTGTSGHLFRNVGLAASWEQLSAGPAQAVVSSLAAGALPADTQVRPLVATTSAGVFRSGDGGTNWTKVYPAAGSDSGSSTLTTATFSPLDPHLLYAGNDAGGSAGGDVLRSTDGGLTFTPFDDGLPQVGRNVGAIAVSPTNPPLVIAALDSGTGGGGHLVAQTDSSAPAPAPTAPAEAAVALPSQTSLPAFTPAPAQTAPGTPPPASTSRSVFRRALDWPLPLAVELLVVVVAVYIVLRWRQRRLDIEGPP